MNFEFSYQWSYYPLFGAKPITNGDSISGDFTVKIYPLWYKQITVEWSIPAAWGNCTFNIYKSDSQEFSTFTKLNVVPLTGNYIKDTTTQDFSKINKGWFIVEAVLSSGKRIQSNPTTWINKRNAWVELRAQEIQRREWFLLTHYTGAESYVFKRKTYGQRCKECWNFQLEKVLKDKCDTCMGTSFEGGYFDGLRTYIQYDPTPNDMFLEYFGKWEKNEFPAWTIAVSELKSRDLVYRVPDGALYYVDDHSSTELQTVSVRQLLKLIELDKESPEFKLIAKNNIIPSLYQ